jgi:hypothetical protein
MPRLVHDSISPTRVQLIVQPGDALDVSDDVAEQLCKASLKFKPAPRRGRPPKVDVVAEVEDD